MSSIQMAKAILKSNRNLHRGVCVCVCVWMWTQFFCSGYGKIQAVVNKAMNTKTGIVLLLTLVIEVGELAVYVKQVNMKWETCLVRKRFGKKAARKH